MVISSDAFLTDTLTGVLKNDYNDKSIRAERIESHENKFISKRIGIAEGKLILPNDFYEQFDNADKEVTELFEKSVD